MKNKILILPIVLSMILFAMFMVSATASVSIIAPANTTYADIHSQLVNITSSTNGNLSYSFDNGVTNHTYTSAFRTDFANGIYVMYAYVVNSTNATQTNLASVDFTVNVPNDYESSPAYQVMNGSGAGLGILIQYLAQALPILLIILGFVGVIFIIGLAIGQAIKNTIHRK